MNTEVYRIIFTARRIFNNFYQNHRFLVLPYLPKGDTKRIVTFPNLNFSNHESFWAVVKRFSDHNPSKKHFVIPSSTKLFLKSELSKLEPISKDEIEKIQKDWQKIEKAFFRTLNNIFDLKILNLKTIKIRPTRFGTYSSYSPINKTGNIFIYIRIDSGIENIGEMIVSVLIRHLLQLPNDELKQDIDWIKKENTSDFLLKHSQLSQFFPDFKPTLEIIDKIYNARIVQESSLYLAKLGFPIRSILEWNNGNIINKQKGEILHGLSSMQAKVLKLLTHKKNSICSFDEIAEILWKEKAKEKFSLYAISKIIQRTRDCLKQNEIAPELIHTQRGKGYVLYD